MSCKARRKQEGEASQLLSQDPQSLPLVEARGQGTLGAVVFCSSKQGGRGAEHRRAGDTPLANPFPPSDL